MNQQVMFDNAALDRYRNPFSLDDTPLTYCRTCLKPCNVEWDYDHNGVIYESACCGSRITTRDEAERMLEERQG